MKIGIAGAGIGGLSAAALLADDGHQVTLFDQFAAPGPVGSGLILQPVGLEVLDAFEAGEVARGLGQPILRMEGYEAQNGIRVLDVSYGATPERQGLGIHRAALFDTLYEAAKTRAIPVETDARVTGREGPYLLIADRKAGPFDLIIDACGAGSLLSPLRARPLPYGAVWATVPWPEGTPLKLDQLSQVYRQADRMLGVLPVGQMSEGGEALAAVFYSLRTDQVEAWTAQDFEAWKDAATALWPELGPFLAPLTNHDAFTVASYTHGTMRQPWASGIAHIGDAAHRTSPQLGQGANMALLDARALQLALRRDRGDDALRHYAAARWGHVRAYQAMSAAFTPQYQSDSRVLPILRDRLLAPLSRTWPTRRVLTRLVCGDLLPPLGGLTPRPPRTPRARA